MDKCPKHPNWVGEQHEHTHRHGDEDVVGYTHTHEYPCCELHPLAAKPHYHENWNKLDCYDYTYHSHPHPELS